MKLRKVVVGRIGPQGPVGASGATGLPGAMGVDGSNGERGLQGSTGASGAKGATGSMGLSGLNGSVPNHKWVGNKLSFQNPDGSWGEERDLTGPKGASGESGRGFVGGGAATNSTIRYTAVTTATYTVVESTLVSGENIFGVNYAGNVTITIPRNISSDKLITINDESCNAGTYNITVETA